jgi:riboflavin biosynthesis pyrimidine reductase
VDHLVLYQAPLVLGLGGLDWSKSPATSPALSDAKPLKLLKISTFGNDVCIEYTKS